MNLNGRKILFIGIGFYDYDELIVNKLESYGAVVTYICQEHGNYIVSQLNRSKHLSALERRYSDKYLSRKLLEKSNYDDVFVIKGDRLTVQNVETLRENNPNAIFRLYQWDSIKRFVGDKKIFGLFDQVYSFDRVDSDNYNYSFVPLFFRNEIARKDSYKYDLSFVGWLHFTRLELLIKMSEELIKVGQVYKFYLFTSTKNWFLLNVIRKLKFVHRKTLNYKSYSQIISDSNAILDFHHPDQDGLTMRTIEAVGANRKIITTNVDIKHYDFYNESNVFILNGEIESSDIASFLSKDFVHIPSNILNGYSLSVWLERIFNNVDLTNPERLDEGS